MSQLKCSHRWPLALRNVKCTKWMYPGSRFTIDFCSWCKFDGNSALLIFHYGPSDRNIFCTLHDTHLSCHLQNFVVITLLESRWEWNEISIEYELRCKQRLWNDTTGIVCTTRAIKTRSENWLLTVKTIMRYHGNASQKFRHSAIDVLNVSMWWYNDWFKFIIDVLPMVRKP